MENGKLDSMSISTKKGDRGKTSLTASGRKKIVCKDCLEVKAIGSVDELNSFLGLAASFTRNGKLTRTLRSIQEELFLLGSVVVGNQSKFPRVSIAELEKEMACLEKRLPKLTKFVLPGGSQVASFLHVARCVARRAERDLVALKKKDKFDPAILVYLNRLSDFLFLLAREANRQRGIGEKYPQI